MIYWEKEQEFTMEKIRHFILLVATTFLMSACGGGSGDSGGGSGNSGGGSQPIVLAFSSGPTSISLDVDEPQSFTYSTNKAGASFSLESVTGNIEITLVDDRVDVFSEVAGSSSFVVVATLGDETARRPVSVTTKAPYLGLAMIGSPDLQLRAGSTGFRIRALALDVQFSYETSGDHLTVSISESVAVENGDSMATESQVSVKLNTRDDTPQTLTITAKLSNGAMNTYSLVFEPDLSASMSGDFCLIGYCDDYAPKAFSVGDDQEEIIAHYLGFAPGADIFPYHLRSSFGTIENITVQAFLGDSLVEGFYTEIDQDEQRILIDTTATEIALNGRTLSYVVEVTNSSDEQEAMSFLVYYERRGDSSVNFSPFERTQYIPIGEWVTYELKPIGSGHLAQFANGGFDDYEITDVYPFKQAGFTSYFELEHDFDAKEKTISLLVNLKDEYTIESLSEDVFFPEVELNISLFNDKHDFFRFINARGKIRVLTEGDFHHIIDEWEQVRKISLAEYELDRVIYFLQQVLVLHNAISPQDTAMLNDALLISNAENNRYMYYYESFLVNPDFTQSSIRSGTSIADMENILQQKKEAYRLDTGQYTSTDMLNINKARAEKLEWINRLINTLNMVSSSQHHLIKEGDMVRTVLASGFGSYFIGNPAFGEFKEGHWVFNPGYRYLINSGISNDVPVRNF